MTIPICHWTFILASALWGVTAQMLSVAAGTVANGGVNPVTKKQVFDSELLLSPLL